MRLYSDDEAYSTINEIWKQHRDEHGDLSEMSDREAINYLDTVGKHIECVAHNSFFPADVYNDAIYEINEKIEERQNRITARSIEMRAQGIFR